jgi:hypothetical protein
MQPRLIGSGFEIRPWTSNARQKAAIEVVAFNLMAHVNERVFRLSTFSVRHSTAEARTQRLLFPAWLKI